MMVDTVEGQVMFLHVSCNCLMVGDFIPTLGGMDAAELLIPLVPKLFFTITPKFSVKVRYITIEVLPAKSVFQITDTKKIFSLMRAASIKKVNFMLLGDSAFCMTDNKYLVFDTEMFLKCLRSFLHLDLHLEFFMSIGKAVP